MKNYFKVTKYALINFLLMIIGQLSGAGIYTILIKNNKLISDKFINFSLVTISAELTAFLLVWLFAKYYFKIQIPNIFSNSKSALKLIIPILIFIILNLLSYLQTFQKNGFQLKIVLVSLLVGLSIGLFEEFATRLTLIAYNQENNLI
ncbi:MAG: hypothetical protein LBC17_01705, partial [Lactobacillaceae bacterium]|nr:hypothetical protein [Lactobacillaceae bacterium]